MGGSLKEHAGGISEECEPHPFLPTLRPSMVSVVDLPRRRSGRYWGGMRARTMYAAARTAIAVTAQNCQSDTGTPERRAIQPSSNTTKPSRSSSTSRESSSYERTATSGSESSITVRTARRDAPLTTSTGGLEA